MKNFLKINNGKIQLKNMLSGLKIKQKILDLLQTISE
jgi:hypothetical protein